MRLKFKQGGTDAVIAVTNVHYCKHKVKVFDNKPDDEVDEFGNTYRCGLLVSQQGMPQNTGLMFVGISRFNCNDIVEELLKYGYADISDYEYTDIIRINGKQLYVSSFDKKYFVSFQDRNDKNAQHLLITNYKIGD